jgi:protein SCO1
MASEQTTAGAASVARTKGRRWPRLLAQLAPLLVGAALLILGALVMNSLKRGTATPDPTPEGVRVGGRAPDFRLQDQFGAAVSLDALRGKAVALTFLYSSCPDVCPVTLGKFRLARDQLGAARSDTAFLVVTVDPERDNPGRLRQYLAAQGLEQAVAFLSGERTALERVWRDYGITVARGPGVAEGAAEGYEVIHTDRIYLIDRAGCLRAVLRSTAAPQELLVALAGLDGPRTAEETGCA